MRIFRIVVRPDPGRPDTLDGMVRAKTEAQAKAMVPKVPHMFFFPEHPEKMWPGDPSRLTEWTRGVSAEKHVWLEQFARRVFEASAGPSKH